MRTIATELARRARELPDRLFVRFPDADLSYRQFEARTRALAAGLTRWRVGAPMVPTLLPNCADAALFWFAANHAGRVWAPLNTEFRGRGLAHAINLTGSRDLVVDASMLEPVLEIRDRLQHVERLIVREGDAGKAGDGARDIGPHARPATAAAAHPLPTLPLEALFLEDDGADPILPARESAPSLLIYTSGTTGVSKACELSHRYVLGHGAILAEATGMRMGDVLFCPYPIFHWDATIGTIAPALHLGIAAVVTERFSVSRFWSDVRRYGVTIFDFMGATLTFLHKQPARPDDADNPARLGWGVPMPAFKEDFERRFGVALIEGYGSTEVGIVVCQEPGAAYPPGSCGRCSPTFRLRIVDENDRTLPPGEIGEIVVRAAAPEDRHLLLNGYYGMESLNREAFRGGWFHTGDLGRLDEAGNLYFEGRSKDAIRRRGENISAFEIEQVIEAHPAVLEVAAYGLPSEFTEEEVAASVVPRPGHALDADDLRKYCEGRMARYMVPVHLRFLKELPRTPTEKVEKAALRRRHLRALGGEPGGAAKVAGRRAAAEGTGARER